MLKVAVGHSEDVDAIDAIEEVIQQCRQSLGDSSPKAGILFADFEYDHSVMLDQINKAFPNIELIGCTTNGELSSEGAFLEDSVVLICLASDSIEMAVGLGKNLAADPVAATRHAVEGAQAKLSGDPQLCITYYESLTTSANVVLTSLKGQFDQPMPIFGGTAAGPWMQQKTRQFYMNEVLNDAIPLLLFSGDVLFSFGVATGWKPFGRQHTVTKVDYNVVYEIDDQSAVELYRSYLGSHERISAEFPLAVFEKNMEGFYLRAPLLVENDGSLQFAGDIPEGATVQLTQSIHDDILAAVKTAAEQALEGYTGKKKPALALITSCAARRAVLGTRVIEEYEILSNALPDDVIIGGYYSYGELCPLDDEEPSRFHNETFVTLLIGEK